MRSTPSLLPTSHAQSDYHHHEVSKWAVVRPFWTTAAIVVARCKRQKQQQGNHQLSPWHPPSLTAAGSACENIFIFDHLACAPIMPGIDSGTNEAIKVHVHTRHDKTNPLKEGGWMLLCWKQIEQRKPEIRGLIHAQKAPSRCLHVPDFKILCCELKHQWPVLPDFVPIW